jgi:hypothetical protein
MKAHFSQEPLLNSPISQIYTLIEWEQTMRYFSAYDPNTFVSDRKHPLYKLTLTTAHQLNKLAYPEAYTSAKGRTIRTLQDDMIDLVKQLLAFAKDIQEEEDETEREFEIDCRRKIPLPLAKDHVYEQMPSGKKRHCFVCAGARLRAAGKGNNAVRRGCPLCQHFFSVVLRVLKLSTVAGNTRSIGLLASK